MALASQVETIPNKVDVRVIGTDIAESSGSNWDVILLAPGLEEDEVEEARRNLQEQEEKEDWEEVDNKWDEITHSGSKKDNSSVTKIKVRKPAAICREHERTQRILEAVGGVLSKTGMTIEVSQAPSNFYKAVISDYLNGLQEVEGPVPVCVED